jgi:hypothetical protein
MPDLTPAETPSVAAERLRYLLHPDGMPEQIRADWTQQPFPAQQGVITVPGEDTPVLAAFWGGVTEYLVAMQPTVGEALATWLETEAASNAGDEDHAGCTAQTCTLTAALATARAILAGGQP